MENLTNLISKLKIDSSKLKENQKNSKNEIILSEILKIEKKQILNEIGIFIILLQKEKMEKEIPFMLPETASTYQKILFFS